MDWKSTLFGAAIGFVASIGTMIAQRLFDRAGKLKMYCRLISGDSDINKVGFVNDCGTIVFIFPMALQMQNTSNSTRVIRDVSAWIYKQGKPIAKMIQLQSTVRTSSTKEKTISEYGGDKSMYSFVVQPRSIQSECCSFLIKASPCEFEKLDFDEVRLSYFDERDKKHVFPVKKIENVWVPGRIDIENEWISLKKQKRIEVK